MLLLTLSLTAASTWCKFYYTAQFLHYPVHNFSMDTCTTKWSNRRCKAAIQPSWKQRCFSASAALILAASGLNLYINTNKVHLHTIVNYSVGLLATFLVYLSSCLQDRPIMLTASFYGRPFCNHIQWFIVSAILFYCVFIGFLSQSTFSGVF